MIGGTDRIPFSSSCVKSLSPRSTPPSKEQGRTEAMDGGETKKET